MIVRFHGEHTAPYKLEDRSRQWFVDETWMIRSITIEQGVAWRGMQMRHKHHGVSVKC
jgi:radical SAM superfamily enzyme with C-terminal helix-hairpin-helix motif